MRFGPRRVSSWALTGFLLIAACQRGSNEPAVLGRSPIRPLSEETRARWSALLPTLEIHPLPRQGPTQVAQKLVPWAFEAKAKSSAPTALVAFWASYCPPCLAEMPTLNALHRAGQRVLGVSLDAMEDIGAAQTAMERHDVLYPNAIVTRSSLPIAGRALPEGLPFTLEMNREGTVNGRMALSP